MTVADLTTEQLTVLARRLHGTSNNVYGMVATMYSISESDESIFDRLEKECDLFHCEGCSVWYDKSEGDRSVKGFCAECVNDMNATLE